MDKNHGPRNGNAPHGSEAKGETKSTPNSNTGAPLRDDPLQGWFDLAKPAFDASRDSFETSTSRLLGEKL